MHLASLVSAKRALYNFRSHPMKARKVRVIAALLAAAVLSTLVEAHDIPDEIVVQSYVAPRQDRLQVLLRVPLIAIADANLPKDGVGYLAMPYLDPALREAANQISNGIVFLERDDRLTGYELANARISLPSDRSFNNYETALQRVRGEKLPDTTQIYYNQGFLDLELIFPIRSQDSPFSMRVLFGRGLAQRTATYITFIRPDAAVRTFRIHDDTPLVHLDPTAVQTAWTFLTAGFYRFLDGLEHLLFVIALALPYRRLRNLATPMVAFAVSFSATLSAATFMLPVADQWLTAAIGTVVALSLVYVAIENGVVVWNGLDASRYRPIFGLVFGIGHGLAFAIALQDTVQFAGSHHAIALFAFSVGLVLGTIIILAIAVPALDFLFARTIAERTGIVVASLLIGHSGWHWMTERFAIVQLATGPTMDLPLLLIAVRWLLALTVVGGALWFIAGLFKRKPVVPDVPEKSIVDSR
jgi:hypothetical protein